MSVYGELRQLMAELELISHTSAVNLDGKSGRDAGEDIGGKRPPGGDREHPAPEDRDAFLTSYHRRTVDYFRREIMKVMPVFSPEHWERRMEELRDEALDTLDAWRRAPKPAQGIELEPDSFYWKCAIADDDRDMDTIKRVYSVSRSTVYRHRKKYRGLRARVPSGQ